MTEAEGQYRYRDNEHSKERFLARFQRVLGLNYSAKYPAPEAVIDEAWEMLGLNRTEREVVLAIDWLREGFDKSKPGKSLRAAREHAHAVVSKEQAVTREQARGGMSAIIADSPQLTDAGRAYMAVTRWCMREIAELGRQGKEIGHPERQAVHEAHAMHFAAIDRGDADRIASWIAWTDAENHLDTAQKANRREVRCA